MAFFYVLRSLNLSSQDEVLLQLPNCSVMFNAVLRAGAKPVGYDVDLNCLGSDLSNIEKLVTDNTKVIVVQHTLGIPCEIGKINDYCRRKKIILIEDCALSVSTTYENRVLGNFGDYSIFSFDTTKPINTVVGGILYSRLRANIKEIRQNYDNLPELSRSFRFYILFNAFMQYYFSRTIPFVSNLAYIVNVKVLSYIGNSFIYPFLYNDNDSKVTLENLPYPYPAKYSECFAYLGLLSLSDWDNTVDRRIVNMNRLLKIIKELGIGEVPGQYFSNNKIVPLRLVVILQSDSKWIGFFDKLYDRNSMWFISPLACNEAYIDFNISSELIPNCIYMNERVINIPVDEDKEVDKLIMSLMNFYD